MKFFVDDLLYKDECFKIIGICMKIHSILGKGFYEVVYKDALEIELQKNQIPYHREKQFKIKYEGIELKRKFRADFLAYSAILLEIKAQHNIPGDAFNQTLNYLKSAEIKLGITINFGEDRLQFQRIVCTY